MLSYALVARSLAALLELFPSRDVTKATAAAYQHALADLSDDEFTVAVDAIARESGRRFFPTAGELRAVLPTPPPVDIDALLKTIERLGSHNVHTGWCWPSIARVREALGDAVAAAYAEVGPGALSAHDEVTHDIARRTFTRALALQRKAAADAPALPRARPALPEQT